jgi:hypothetical protein
MPILEAFCEGGKGTPRRHSSAAVILSGMAVLLPRPLFGRTATKSKRVFCRRRFSANPSTVFIKPRPRRFRTVRQKRLGLAPGVFQFESNQRIAARRTPRYSPAEKQFRRLFMTVYTGRTLQTCALRVWGVWVSMRDLHAATLRSNRDLPPGLTGAFSSAPECPSWRPSAKAGRELLGATQVPSS